MHEAATTVCARIAVALFAAGVPAHTRAAGAESPLVLAKDGKTDYSIVIAGEAATPVVKAAEELSTFLEQMTGAEYAIRRDDSPDSQFEIVLGETNRKSLRDLPVELQPKAWEGFVILPENSKLFIMGGRIPRGTLYGVYDFLEQELGVRFLAPEANHVPHNSTLRVAASARSFDPPLEYRAHFVPHNARSGYNEWLQRSRINSIGSGYGHVRRLYRTVHTFGNLVPVKQYFDKSPEMFALIDGKRTSRELCLSHPDTLRVATATALDWARGAKDDPGIKSIIHISQGDTGSPGCQCTDCAAADAEEGTPFTGQLIRFVNAVAREIGRDFPDILVETLAYHRSEFPPKKAVAEPNVSVWFAPIGLDLGHPLNEQPKFWDNLQGWRRVSKKIYIWDYPQGFHDLLAPFPSLWPVARNIQLFAENGATGYMPQQPTTDGTEMRYLRNYVMSQLQWRPDRDYRKIADEFCRLYYGSRSGEQIMKYVDLLHDSFRRVDLPLNRHGSFKDDAFVPAADKILSRASQLAESQAQQHRIDEFRLPIWRLMLIQAFGVANKVKSLPEQWAFRADGEGGGKTEGYSTAIDFSDWQQVRIPTIPAAEYGTGGGHGAGWYATHFEMPDTGNSPLALHFEAMDGIWDVHVDGKTVAREMPTGLGLYREKEVPYVLLENGLGSGRHTIVVRVQNGSGFYRLEQYQNPDFTTADPITIVNMSKPLSQELRAAAEGFLTACSRAGLMRISYGYEPTPTPYLKDLLWPKVRFLMTHGG